jgi:serine/threonine protein kinase
MIDVLCGSDVSKLILKKYELKGVIFVGHRSLVLEAFNKSINKNVCIKLIPHFKDEYGKLTRTVPLEVYVQAFLAQHSKYVLPILDYFPGTPFCAMVSPLWGHPWVDQVQRTVSQESLWNVINRDSIEKNLELSKDEAQTIADSIFILHSSLPLGAFRDLHSFLSQSTLTKSQVSSIFEQLILAVNEMKSHGVIHNDIKDENILIDDNLNIKVIDFGSCEFIGEDSTVFRGTLKYASPEISQRTDLSVLDLEAQEIWTLGCVLYALMSNCESDKNDNHMVDIMVNCLLNDKVQRIKWNDLWSALMGSVVRSESF